MSKKLTSVAALGAFTLSLTMSPSVSAEANPFAASDLDSGFMVAAEGKCGEGKCGEGKCGAKGVDMQGNVVELDEKFTYGGDNMATYAGGKLATGTKDPAVCGSFSNEKCSMAHLK